MYLQETGPWFNVGPPSATQGQHKNQHWVKASDKGTTIRQMLSQCCFYVEPPSSTSAQH